uniref:Uncharacterized protein n=1 Tax=Myoviridae sp. ctcFb5 TaxID=2825137 RepID=A0A8S5PVV3_9CAUD|nr:MAG TPA: hypothetical protein [Myoviridae sp. ctcFb5]DAT98808.1 MAG TPA: hypothetical protein [Caudoviricetes sp.]
MHGFQFAINKRIVGFHFFVDHPSTFSENYLLELKNRL